MITRLRRALLIAALSLLTWAATASADETWELWIRKDYDAGMVGQWGVVAAFKTQQDCIKAMQQQGATGRITLVPDGKSLRKTHETDKVAPPAPFLSVAPDGSAATAAKCVSGIVDQRGSKAK